jgi:hypothetical protein
MNTDTRQQCETDDGPAEQPKDPGGKCAEIPEVEPPKLEDPDKCEPDPECCCPKQPPESSPTCFDDLIREQAKQLSEGESAKAFKAELEALLAKAKAANLEYTQEKYTALVKEWDRQDREISELIRKFICAVPCWRCLIECFVCPLLYEIRFREHKLWGKGKLYSEVHSLADLRYWHERNRQTKWLVLERIKGVLAVWEKPAQTIGTVLANNDKLIVDLGKRLSSDATKAVYDLFLRLVPMHLLIAPPASSGYVTKIAKQYTEFCECDEGEPDDCCGPDVGVSSLRRRLLGPQPYLINPRDYFAVICCLTKERYLPAKDAYAKAHSAWESVDTEFKRLEAEIVESMKPGAIEQSAKAAFPPDCEWQKKPDAAAAS